MKRKARILLLAAMAMTLAACSSDDNEGATGVWNGEIRLSCGLDVQSRAATGLLYQYFDQGTEIDVQISEDVESGETATTTYGALVYETTDAKGSLSLKQGDQPYYPSSGNGVDIYAVYPKGSDGTFTVATDQSVDADYKASDLMRASVSTERTSEAVNLAFKHLLSKVTITLESGAGSPDLDGATVELIDVKPTTTFTASSGTIGTAQGEATPIKVFTATSTSLSGSCIVPPQTLATEFVRVTLKDKGVLIGKLNSGTPELAGGNEYKYEIAVNLTGLGITATITDWDGEDNSVESTAILMPEPKALADAAVGDYYTSDGELYDAENITTEQLSLIKSRIIGIVGSTNVNRIGSAEKAALKANGVTNPHGLVVAKTNAATSVAWGAEGTDTGITNTSTPYSDINGLKNCNVIWNGWDDESATPTYSKDNYPAFKAAYDYRTSDDTKAPSGTTGWFLPSSGQWCDILQNIGEFTFSNTTYTLLSEYSPSFYANFNEKMSAVGGDGMSDYTYFWSSSEVGKYDNGHYYAHRLSVWKKGGYVQLIGMPFTVKHDVRCILAF